MKMEINYGLIRIWGRRGLRRRIHDSFLEVLLLCVFKIIKMVILIVQNSPSRKGIK